MSENNPPKGLTDDEKRRLIERVKAIQAERVRLQQEAEEIVAELAADEAFRRQQPGTVHEFRPRPGGDPGDE